MSEEEVNESENNADASDDAGEEESGGGNKMIIIIAAVLLLLIGGGAGAYFTGMLDPLLGGGETEEHAEDDHGEGHDDEAHGDDHGDGHDDHGDKDDHSKKDDGHGKDDHGKKDGHGGDSAFVEIPTMIVNLTGEDGETRFLRLTVQLELEDPSDAGMIEEAMPKVVDQFQTYLRELRVKDLRGSAGIYRLQMELLWRVNQAASPAKIKDVLFQEILIQ